MTKPIRIALVMHGGLGWLGGQEYIRNIILALASLPRELKDTFELSLLASHSTNRNFIASVKPFLKKVYLLKDPEHKAFWYRIKRNAFRMILNRPPCMHGKIANKNNFEFIYPCTSPDEGLSLAETAAWIYDFQHKYLPEFFTRQEILTREYAFSEIALKAPLVVLSSKTAEADFKNFYPEAAFKAKVLPFKIIPQSQWYEENPYTTQQKYHLPDKFFIISNQFWQHKNHLTVFNALKLLHDRGIDPMIVCTGHIYDYRKPEFSDTILQTIHQLGLSQQLCLLGMIPKIDQIQLLRRSIALIQPSLFEGWSTVVEDARCMGKPLILSDLPVHFEQNPPNSRFFKRTSPESLAPVIEDYWMSLSPGPNLEQEAIAGETNRQEVMEFGKSFLEIANSFQSANHDDHRSANKKNR